MPKVSQQHLDERRAALLAAAIRVFGRKGFHGATIKDICAEARVSAGGLYRYFEGKEALIEAAFEDGRERTRVLLDAMREAGGRMANFWPVFGQACREYAAPEGRDEVLFGLTVIAEAARNEWLGARYREQLRAVIAAVAEFVAEAYARGDERPDLPPEQAARLILGAFHGFMVQLSVDPDLDVDAFVGAITRVASPALGAPSSPALGAPSPIDQTPEVS